MAVSCLVSCFSVELVDMVACYTYDVNVDEDVQVWYSIGFPLISHPCQ